MMVTEKKIQRAIGSLTREARIQLTQQRYTGPGDPLLDITARTEVNLLRCDIATVSRDGLAVFTELGSAVMQRVNQDR